MPKQDVESNVGFGDDYEDIQEALTDDTPSKGTKKEEPIDTLPDGADDDMWEDIEDPEDVSEVKEEKDEESKEDEEDKEEEEDESSEEKESERTEETPPKPSDDDVYKDAIVKQLGEDVYLKVKGGSYDVRGMTPQEIKARLQMGERFYQGMEEVAKLRNELTLNIQNAQQLMSQYGTGNQQQTQRAPTNEFLKPSELDTDEVKALKEYALTQDQRLANLEGSQVQSQTRAMEDRIIKEVDSLKEEYPSASTDEVYAVRLLAPQHVSTEEIMRKSHQFYSNPETLRKLIDAAPEAKRLFVDEIIKEYQAKKSKTKTAPQKRSRSSGTRKVSSKKSESKGLGYDFDKAGAAAEKYIAEMERSVSEED